MELFLMVINQLGSFTLNVSQSTYYATIYILHYLMAIKVNKAVRVSHLLLVW